MKLKIFYRSATIWNIILFVMLSFIFLFIQESILNNKSILDIIFFKNVVNSFKYYIGLTFIGVVSLYFLKTFSKVIYSLIILSAVCVTSYNLYLDFSKLITIVLFLFVLISYYYYHLLNIELKQSFYNAGFSKNNLYDPMLFTIVSKIKSKKSEAMIEGYLTNWNEDGCFIHSKSKYDVVGSKVELAISFEGQEFKQAGEIVSCNKGKENFGIRFINEKKTGYNWKDFYNIINDMGFEVEFLR